MKKISPLFLSRTVVAVLLLAIIAGCRSVDRVDESTPDGVSGYLPHAVDKFVLFESEGILVYARDSASARDVAARAEQAEKLLTEKTGEIPSKMVYFAIDHSHPDRQSLHAKAFRTSSQQWKMRERALDFSGSQGVKDESEMGSKLEETFPMILPGLLDTPQPHPDSFPPFGVALATSRGMKSGLDDMIDFGIENSQLTTLQRIFAAPFIAILRNVLIDVLAKVEHALIIGTHLRGRPGWNEERIQEVMTSVLDLEDFRARFGGSKPSRPPAP